MVAAAVTHYRKEFIGTFEQTVSMLRQCATREQVIKGNTAVFLVAGSGGATAVTRGSNGKIPYGQNSNTQKTATLLEKHAPFEMTGFNIFASQGDQNAIMRRNSMGTINRDIDQTIIDILDTSTQTTGTTATATLAMVSLAKGVLGKADVDVSDMENLFAVVSPAFLAYLEQVTAYSSGDYVDIKPLAGITRKVWRWSGINWILSTRISGIGTNTEKCYLFHRDAIGYAVNVGDENIMLGYDEKEDTSWTRATVYHGGVLLQNTGVVMMKHDGSAIVAGS
jgi:hypothetical protein